MHALMQLARWLQSPGDPIYLRACQNINSQGYMTACPCRGVNGGPFSFMTWATNLFPKVGRHRILSYERTKRG